MQQGVATHDTWQCLIINDELASCIQQLKACVGQKYICCSDKQQRLHHVSPMLDINTAAHAVRDEHEVDFQYQEPAGGHAVL